MLYNNGYIIKDLVQNVEISSSFSTYSGIASCHNWPLNNYKDKISIGLTDLTINCFEKNNYVEIINDTELLKKYAEHCEVIGIPITIMKVMTCNNTIIADKDLREISFLGYDCIVGDSISYLAEIYFDGADGIELFKTTKSLVNANGLLNTYEEAKRFITERNKLIENGVDLEDYWQSVPARLSLVCV